MSMWLKGAAGEFDLRMSQLGAAMEIAQQHGWVPAGTRAYTRTNGVTGEEVLDFPEWQGGYLSNDYQEVTADDAAAWAAALERALPDVPDERPYASGNGDRLGSADQDNPYQLWAGDKVGLRELIAFMRAGAFTMR